MKEKWIKCLIKIKKLVRDQGRTNFVSKNDMDRILVEHEINLFELEKELSSMGN